MADERDKELEIRSTAVPQELEIEQRSVYTDVSSLKALLDTLPDTLPEFPEIFSRVPASYRARVEEAFRRAPTIFWELKPLADLMRESTLGEEVRAALCEVKLESLLNPAPPRKEPDATEIAANLETMRERVRPDLRAWGMSDAEIDGLGSAGSIASLMARRQAGDPWPLPAPAPAEPPRISEEEAARIRERIEELMREQEAEFEAAMAAAREREDDRRIL